MKQIKLTYFTYICKVKKTGKATLYGYITLHAIFIQLSLNINDALMCEAA